MALLRSLRSLIVSAAIAVVMTLAPAAHAAPQVAFDAPIELTGTYSATAATQAWFFDATGDGVTDAVWARGTGVSVWPYSNGSFTTTATEIPLVPDGGYVAWFEVGDMNGDGRPDLVFSDGGQVFVAFQQSGGIFATPTVAYGESPMGHAVGDVDADGIADLIVEHWTGSALELHQIDYAAGSWTDTNLGIAGESDDAIMLSDLNGDGRVDIVASSGSPTV